MAPAGHGLNAPVNPNPWCMLGTALCSNVCCCVTRWVPCSTPLTAELPAHCGSPPVSVLLGAIEGETRVGRSRSSSIRLLSSAVIGPTADLTEVSTIPCTTSSTSFCCRVGLSLREVLSGNRVHLIHKPSARTLHAIGNEN